MRVIRVAISSVAVAIDSMLKRAVGQRMMFTSTGIMNCLWQRFFVGTGTGDLASWRDVSSLSLRFARG